MRLEWLLLCNSSFVFCITCWVLLKENPPPPNQSLLGRPKDGQAASYHGEVLEGAWRFAVFRSPNTSKCCQLLSCVSIFCGHGGVTTSRFPSHSLWPFLVATATARTSAILRQKTRLHAMRRPSALRVKSGALLSWVQLEMCSFDPPLGVSHDEIGLMKSVWSKKIRRGR